MCTDFCVVGIDIRPHLENLAAPRQGQYSNFEETFMRLPYRAIGLALCLGIAPGLALAQAPQPTAPQTAPAVMARAALLDLNTATADQL